MAQHIVVYIRGSPMDLSRHIKRIIRRFKYLYCIVLNFYFFFNMYEFHEIESEGIFSIFIPDIYFLSKFKIQEMTTNVSILFF